MSLSCWNAWLVAMTSREVCSSPINMTLGRTRRLLRSSQLLLEWQAAFSITQTRHFHYTHIHVTSAWRCFWESWEPCSSIITQKPLHSLLNCSTILCPIRPWQVHYSCWCFRLHSFAPLWPKGQDIGLKVSVWNSSAPDYPKCADVFLGLWFRTAGGAGNSKVC